MITKKVREDVRIDLAESLFSDPVQGISLPPSPLRFERQDSPGEISGSEMGEKRSLAKNATEGEWLERCLKRDILYPSGTGNPGTPENQLIGRNNA